MKIQEKEKEKEKETETETTPNLKGLSYYDTVFGKMSAAYPY
jgi:hypothetical protein